MKVDCPICGENIDLDDEKAATEHMSKDAAHRAQLKVAKEDVTRQNTAGFMEQLCGSGLLRRVPDRHRSPGECIKFP